MDKEDYIEQAKKEIEKEIEKARSKLKEVGCKIDGLKISKREKRLSNFQDENEGYTWWCEEVDEIGLCCYGINMDTNNHGTDRQTDHIRHHELLKINPQKIRYKNCLKKFSPFEYSGYSREIKNCCKSKDKKEKREFKCKFKGCKWTFISE